MAILPSPPRGMIASLVRVSPAESQFRVEVAGRGAASGKAVRYPLAAPTTVTEMAAAVTPVVGMVPPSARVAPRTGTAMVVPAATGPEMVILERVSSRRVGVTAMRALAGAGG